MGAAASPLYYITNLTTLLESIALIIDQHQPVVEKYYGEGRMRVVVVRLQAEGDKGVKILVEGWEEERRVGRLVSAVVGVSTIALTLRRSRKRGNLSSRTSPIRYNISPLNTPSNPTRARLPRPQATSHPPSPHSPRHISLARLPPSSRRTPAHRKNAHKKTTRPRRLLFSQNNKVRIRVMSRGCWANARH